MIILGAHVGSLAEYIDAGGEIEISRPEKCPGCQGVRTFWKHTSYWRSVIEGDIEAQVRVPRFRCKVRSCKLVVSVMLGFLIPYIRFTVRTTGTAIENLIVESSSLRSQSQSMAALESEGTPRPAASTIHSWLERLLSRASWLVFQMQKELVLGGHYFPNNGTSTDPTGAKRSPRELLRTAIDFGRILLRVEEHVIEKLLTYFLSDAEQLECLLSGKALRATFNRVLNS